MISRRSEHDPPCHADDSLSADGLKRVVAACDRFEAAWAEGHPLPIESELEGVAGCDRPRLLRELVALEVELRRRGGQAPTEAEYASRFPEHRSLIARAFAVDSGESTADYQASPPRVGKYEVIRRLGRGGQATTDLARDPDLQRLVVIKRYHRVDDADRHDAVLREGQALARIRSPYVAACHGIEDLGGEVALVMEYVPGRPLSEVTVTQLGPFDRRAELMERVAAGVAAVHACGLLHRDIKPQNIILGEDGAPRLVDFGLASPLAGERLADTCGSPQYMAPEQARGQAERIDARTDVFGLGAVLYQTLTGHPPHEGGSREEVLESARSGRITPPRAWDARIPRSLERLCLRALAADPVDRPASASDLSSALRRHRRRGGYARFAGIAAAVVALAALGAWWSRPAPSPLDGRIAIQHNRYFDDIRHMEAHGLIGRDSVACRTDDSLKVEVTLSEPAYAYLLALNPDGQPQLCVPDDERTRPRRWDRYVFPPEADAYYRLRDGAGFQAFVLVASRKPLPPFADWDLGIGDLPWNRFDAEGVWEVDRLGPRLARTAPAVERGQVVRHDVAPWPLVDVCDRLRAHPSIDLVRAIGFPVRTPGHPQALDE